MQMQQLIERACRSAAGTLPTSHQKKRTLRKKLVVRERRVEEEKEQRARAQTAPHQRGDGALTRYIRSLVHEIEVR